MASELQFLQLQPCKQIIQVLMLKSAILILKNGTRNRGSQSKYGILTVTNQNIYPRELIELSLEKRKPPVASFCSEVQMDAPLTLLDSLIKFQPTSDELQAIIFSVAVDSLNFYLHLAIGFQKSAYHTQRSLSTKIRIQPHNF